MYNVSCVIWNKQRQHTSVYLSNNVYMYTINNGGSWLKICQIFWEAFWQPVSMNAWNIKFIKSNWMLESIFRFQHFTTRESVIAHQKANQVTYFSTVFLLKVTQGLCVKSYYAVCGLIEPNLTLGSCNLVLEPL